jgi:hypothetical protein
MPAEPRPRVAIVLRGDSEVRRTMRADNSMLAPLVSAFSDVGLEGEIAVYGEDFAEEVRDQLLSAHAALVWVDPVSGSDDRRALDALLRDVAAHGVYVSAHPDVILKMGTKQVLYDTRELSWGVDTHLYNTVGEFRDQFPARLASAGPRVLKQYRGNGGIGVHKVELLTAAPTDDAVVRVQHARVRDAPPDEVPLREFMTRCAKYFGYADGRGRLIDQPFQIRVADGMIRCYFVKGEVVGFGRQFPPATDTPSTTPAFGLAADKTMYPRDDAQFANLRASAERDWVPALQRIVGVTDAELPILWDADFLFGPKTATGDDTYVLCEINISAVFPFPPHALPKLAAATAKELSGRPR